MKARSAKHASPEGRLCYVGGTTAWFTTQDLRSQWGDDWGSPGYERVSGLPYRYTKYDREDGLSPWEIVPVEFSGEFLRPCDPPGPTRWSVGELNAGARPWLRGRDPSGSPVEIPAGVGLAEFRRLVASASGRCA